MYMFMYLYTTVTYMYVYNVLCSLKSKEKLLLWRVQLRLVSLDKAPIISG